MHGRPQNGTAMSTEIMTGITAEAPLPAVTSPVEAAERELAHNGCGDNRGC